MLLCWTHALIGPRGDVHSSAALVTKLDKRCRRSVDPPLRVSGRGARRPAVSSPCTTDARAQQWSGIRPPGLLWRRGGGASAHGSRSAPLAAAGRTRGSHNGCTNSRTHGPGGQPVAGHALRLTRDCRSAGGSAPSDAARALPRAAVRAAPAPLPPRSPPLPCCAIAIKKTVYAVPTDDKRRAPRTAGNGAATR